MKTSKILIGGDPHNSSRPYGGHVDYPGETLEINENTVKICKEHKITHLIDTGDFSYSRFSLDYRMEFENLLQQQYDIVNGNRYSVQGNHDISSRGNTEWDYYVKRGLLKVTEQIELEKINLIFLPFCDIERGKTLKSYIPPTVEGKMNILITHNYIKFKDTPMPQYGDTAHIIDDLPNLHKIDLIISGHIHKQYKFKGYVDSGKPDGSMKEMGLVYLGSPPRPALTKDIDQDALFLCIEENEDGVFIEEIRMPLRPIEEAFILGNAVQEAKKIDVSDIVESLDNRIETYIDPIAYINSRTDITKEIREKAISLYESSADME